jgi:hypothetical protein
MWTVPRPSRSAVETYALCISKYDRSNPARPRLRSAVGVIEDASARFVSAAEQNRLWGLEEGDFQVAGITADEMESVYDRMVDKRHPARMIYDEILTSAEFCPSCGHYKPRTLDHFLPKRRFPALAVDPANLVPACRDCNFVKLSSAATSPESEGFHPYFNSLPNRLWLIGHVLETAPATVEYFVEPPDCDDWDPTLLARVKNHFLMFGLADVYASQAGTLVSGIRKYLDSNLYSVGGPEVVRSYLADMAESYSGPSVNTWQSAAYAALSRSDWYCDGGFNQQ